MVPKGNQSTLPTLGDGERLTWAVRVVYWRSLTSGDSVNSVEHDAEWSVCPLRPHWILRQTRNCKSWSLHMRENYTLRQIPKKALGGKDYSKFTGKNESRQALSLGQIDWMVGLGTEHWKLILTDSKSMCSYLKQWNRYLQEKLNIAATPISLGAFP